MLCKQEETYVSCFVSFCFLKKRRMLMGQLGLHCPGNPETLPPPPAWPEFGSSCSFSWQFPSLCQGQRNCHAGRYTASCPSCLFLLSLACLTKSRIRQSSQPPPIPPPLPQTHDPSPRPSGCLSCLQLTSFQLGEPWEHHPHLPQDARETRVFHIAQEEVSPKEQS